MQLREFNEYLARDSKEAIAKIKEKGSAIVYHIGKQELFKTINEIETFFKNANKGIEDINEQTILTMPEPFHAIDECLHVYAAEISGEPVKTAQEKIPMFGWNKEILTKDVGIGLYKDDLMFFACLGKFNDYHKPKPDMQKRK